MPYTYEVSFTLSNNDIPNSNRVYTVVDIVPSFPGGMGEFNQYLAQSIRYPAVDRENNLQGKVETQFVVDTDGSLKDIKILSAPSEAMGAEALRVLKASPKWRPGIYNGRLVTKQFNVPVYFTLGDNGGGNKVYTVLETQPTYPGGIQNFVQYLGNNIRYPAEDRENNLQGRVVIQFVVETDGSLTDVKAIRSPSAAMGAEAVRVASSSPKWIPGKQGGRAVRSQFTIPVNFTLESDAVTDANLATFKAAVIGDPGKRPAIFVDGVEATGDLSKLDQNTFESMTILRAVTATSIYGEKAKNGAILITTKKGKSPKDVAPTSPTTKKQ
jgi:TonB family protein